MIFLLLILALPIVVYSYYWWHATYWSRRGINGPPPRLFYGNWDGLDKLERPGVLQLADWTKIYGKVYGMYEGTRKVLVISDLEMLQQLFLKKFEYFYGRKHFPMNSNVKNAKRVHVFNAEGTRWKRLRTIANPTFSVGSLKKVKHTVEESAVHMVNLMSKHADTNKSFNIHEYFQEYTMDVIARVALGQKEIKQFNNPYTELIKATFLRRIDNILVHSVSALPLVGPVIKKLAMLTAELRGVKFPILMRAIEHAVDERKQQRAKLLSSGQVLDEPEDFIDLFLDAEADTLDDGEEAIDRAAGIKVSRKLSTDEIVAQCFVFLLAGFDTTANSLAYAAFLLAKNPTVMSKLQEEIDEFCTEETINYETLQKLQYMDCVVKEALRMYPLGAFANSRTCMKSTTLGDVPIEKGVMVMADPWSVHYDKEIWGEDAHEFRPERWQDGTKRHLLSWFPFGVGPRQCIGMRLAYMEEKLALAHLLSRYNINAGPDTEKQLDLIGSFTVSPGKVSVYLTKRDLE